MVDTNGNGGGSGTLPPTVNVRFDDPLTVSMAQTASKPALGKKGPAPLWVAIQNRSIDFNSYARFITRAFCSGAGGPDADRRSARADYHAGLHTHLNAVMAKMRSTVPGGPAGDCDEPGAALAHGVNAYQFLKTATEIFLLLECGAFIAEYVRFASDQPAQEQSRDIPGSEGVELPPLEPGQTQLSVLTEALKGYLGDARLPYIQRILESTFGNDLEGQARALPYCDGFLLARANCPCFLELIWSYWHEEGMLVQSLNAISLRFQNRRRSSGPDPLAQLELSPLRPLSSILWGYVQEEQHRLSILRRAYEYEHEYGLTLRGKAVADVRAVDRRSKFLAAFHDLLYRCAVFYRESSNLQIVPDAFPLLNGIKEVHLILSQGAANQFGDLPWTARVEMLIQQWILARPEIREFLGRRPMVNYEEDWMGNADALKTLMGWTDTSISHFRNLGAFGEKILLSIRWHEWASESDQQTARDWALYFRSQIQSYMHAYRAATGIDLSLEPKGAEDEARRAEVPALIFERNMSKRQAAAAGK
jgi:hypothetical protein